MGDYPDIFCRVKEGEKHREKIRFDKNVYGKKKNRIFREGEHYP